MATAKEKLKGSKEKMQKMMGKTNGGKGKAAKKLAKPKKGC